MKIFLALTLCILLQGCGTNLIMPFAKSGPEFIPHIEYFTTLTGRTTYVPINFGNVEPHAAVCHTIGIYKWIEVDKPYWSQATNVERRALVLHELGHCELGKPHVEAELEDTCQASIMHPILLDEVCYNNHETFYLEEYLK